MSKGLKRITGFIEIGTVTIETGPLMGKVYLTVKDSGIGVLLLVEVENIGVDEIDAGILCLRLPCRTLLLVLLLRKSRSHPNNQCDSQQPDKGLPYHLFITPLFIPALEFEVAVLIFVIQVSVYILDLIDHPLMDTILTTFVQHHIL